MRNTSEIEREQAVNYPGLTVRQDADAIVVHVPMRLRRRKGRNILLTPDGHVAEPDRQVSQPLAEAIAKAHRWQEQLESGKYAEITDLAKDVGVDRKYVSRIMELTSLAPDIVQAILAGNEPAGFSLTKLRDGAAERWDEQRRMATGLVHAGLA